MYTTIKDLITGNISTLLGFVAVSLGLLVCTRRPKGIPPGPWFTLPFLGNLLQIGSNPVLSFRKMRKKYGDVFSVYFANRLVIAINGYDNLKEAFVNNGEHFSERPYLFITDYICKGKGVLFSTGETWREQKKFAMHTLRNFGMGRNILEDKIQDEVAPFISVLSSEEGKPYDIRTLLHTSISNVISSIVFGKRFQYDDPVFVRFLKAVDQNNSTSPVFNFFPFLRFVPGDLFKIQRSMKNVAMVQCELIDPSIEEHLRLYDENNIDDFISAYIKEMKAKEAQGEQQTSIDRENLRVTIGDLFISGTETTATTIRWALQFFLYFPEIQDNFFAEIESNVGTNRPVMLKDRADLIYVEATIMETLRYADITPLGLAHSVDKDTYLNGYKIPKGVIIMPVVDSVLADDGVWGDPDNFRPERFIDETGKLFKPDEFIPFFIGRRHCLGEALARMELFLFLSNLIQRFKVQQVPATNLPGPEGKLGFTQVPMACDMRFVPRD